MASNIFDTTHPIEQQMYFHGVIHIKETDKILKDDGDFIVRITKTDEELKYVLSVRRSSRRYHYLIKRGSDEKWHFRDNISFDNLQELIYCHYTTKTPVTPNGPILRTPKEREEWEVLNSQIKLLQKVGSGQFGEVHLGTLTVKDEKITVAVKLCLQSLSEKEKQLFLEEGAIMRRLDHPNIVKLIAIAADKDPIMIVMEYVDGGSLLNYLRKNGARIPPVLCLKFCVMAIRGMEYLENRKCIHRDLAARNCLVNKRKYLKITDFGLAKQGARSYLVKEGERVPIQWMSPETIETGFFTFKSDVWSFGILMWEIYTEGAMPYSMNSEEAANSIRAGKKLSNPEKMPAPVAEQMRSCWKDEKDRANFHNLMRNFEVLYDDDLIKYSQKQKSRKSKTIPHKR